MQQSRGGGGWVGDSGFILFRFPRKEENVRDFGGKDDDSTVTAVAWGGNGVWARGRLPGGG